MIETKGNGVSERRRVSILGLEVDIVDMNQALDLIDQMVQEKGPFQILTPNVDHIMRSQHDTEFLQAYREGDLSVADGAPVVWASRLLGRPLPERVPGSDLMPRMCGLAAKRGYSVYLMGGQPGAADVSAHILRQKYPGLKVVGHACPDFGFEQDPKINNALISEIKLLSPDMLFVALGAPKQDLWIHRHKKELAVPVSVGIGATLDFIAGKVKRAPRFTYKLGLEWLWRLLCEPRRLWRRYLVDDLPFVWKVAGQWWRERNR